MSGCRGCSIVDRPGEPHDCATCPVCGQGRNDMGQEQEWPLDRIAVVRGHERIERLERYLPANYRVLGESTDGTAVIGGTDRAGWTMDGYVIPRLASGLIWAVEMQREDTR